MNTAGNYLDGNAVGGLLQEILVAEATTAERICQSCGAREPVGAHRAYTAAGVVLRCPRCHDVGMRAVELPGRRIVEFRGTWVFAASPNPTSA